MTKLKQMERLLDIMETLRDPIKGCPWDQKQTFASIVPHTIEETYEVVEAIESQQWHDVKEELGDLLFQIVFYGQLGKEQGDFDFDEIAGAMCEKLIRRHPHVFGEKDEEGHSLQEADWEGIKAKEREEKMQLSSESEPLPLSILANVPIHLPALTRAMKLQKRCAQVGFDWKTLGPVVDKVHEEIDEVMEEALMAEKNQARIDEEIGDLLFAVVNLSRHLGTNPETALRKANQKFEKRFLGVESKMQKNGRNFQETTLEEMESWWSEVKIEENENKTD